MHIAAASGFNDATEFLLKQQIPTDTEDKDGWQAIHIAAFWGHVSSHCPSFGTEARVGRYRLHSFLPFPSLPFRVFLSDWKEFLKS